MSDPFIGQIDLFPYNFAPEGYLPCDGVTYPIRQYDALFSLIQYTYGGVVNQTFAVPKLCGLAAVGLGTTTGGTVVWTPGAVNGEECVTLATAEIPAHTHILDILGGGSKNATPTAGDALAGLAVGDYYCVPPAQINTNLNPQSLTPAYAGPAAHTNRQPYVILRPCIAWNGVFPEFD